MAFVKEGGYTQPERPANPQPPSQRTVDENGFVTDPSDPEADLKAACDWALNVRLGRFTREREGGIMSVEDLHGAVHDRVTAIVACQALALHYGAQLRYGPEEPIVGVLGAALDALGVADKDQFVHSVAVTVGDTIYLPFRVGSDEVSYVAQVALVAHECQHVRQGGDEHLEYWIRYFTSKAHRTAYEVKALAVELEVAWRLTGTMGDPLKLAGRLAWYQVGKRDIAVAAKQLAIVANTLTAGGEVCGQVGVIAAALG